MIAVRKTLQKDVFGSGEERLVSLVNVTKPGRKKKPSYLCASGQYSTNYISTIHILSVSHCTGTGGRVLMFVRFL